MEGSKEKWLVPQERGTEAHLHEGVNEPHLMLKYECRQLCRTSLQGIKEIQEGGKFC